MIWARLTHPLRVLALKTVSTDRLLKNYCLASCQQLSVKLNSNCRQYSDDSNLVSGLQSVIPAKADRYAGLHFELSNTNCHKLSSVNQFEKLVQNEIDINTVSKNAFTVQTIWFKVHQENIRFVESLIKLGFEFHHTKADWLYLMRSLGPIKNVPKYAYTNIGVGALVINDQMKVLVVKEKHSPIKPRWKFPGGYAEQGEELSATAEREVLEETGVKTQFQSVLLVRHMHRFAFDCSDLYFVCLLKPITENIIICDHEIEQCKWESCHIIRNETTPFNKFVIDKYLEWQKGTISIQPETLDPNHKLIPKYEIYSMKPKSRE